MKSYLDLIDDLFLLPLGNNGYEEDRGADRQEPVGTEEFPEQAR